MGKCAATEAAGLLPLLRGDIIKLAPPSILLSRGQQQHTAMQELVIDPKKFENHKNDHPLNQHEDSSWHAYFQA